MSTPPTSADRLRALQATLTSLLAQRAETDEKIAAIRSTLNGVQLGQKLAAEERTGLAKPPAEIA